jgi:hypothetical protein
MPIPDPSAVKPTTPATPGAGATSAPAQEPTVTVPPAAPSPQDVNLSKPAEGTEKEGFVPKSRLDEVIAQRNIERQQREDLERKLRDAESYRVPASAGVAPTGNAAEDIFTNPNSVIDGRVNPRLSGIENQLNNIENQNMEQSLRADFNDNPVLQNMYGSYDELSYAIDVRGKQIGFDRKLTPKERRLVYSDLIESRKGDIVKIAMDMGREDGKKRREIVPVTVEGDGSNVTPVKGKAIVYSAEEMAFMKKIGLSPEEAAAHAEKSQNVGGKIKTFHPDL